MVGGVNGGLLQGGFIKRGGQTTRKDDASFLPFDGNNAHEVTPSEGVTSCALHRVGWGKGGRHRVGVVEGRA